MTTAVSPPQQPEELVPSSQATRVSPKTVNEAVKALLQWRSEKSKTEKPQLLEQDEFVYLFVTMKKIPQTNRTNAHRIPIPHPLINAEEDSPEICLIIDDRPNSGLTKQDAKKKIKSENIPVTKVLKLSTLRSDYRPYEAKRQLCDSYNMFFTDRRIVHLLPRLIGKKFFLSKKIPIALDLKHRNWKEQIAKACGSAMFFMRTGTSRVIKVGKLSMKSDEIVENVMATLNGVVEILPGKWKYVRSLHLKLSESLALPIYQAVPDLKLKIDDFETDDSLVVKDDKKKKKGKSVEDALVTGSESGKKKKGRIHEVRYMDSNVSEVLDEDEIGDVEVSNEIVESGDKEKKTKKRKKVGEVAESEKPVKKAAKGKLKESAKPKEKSTAAKGKLKESAKPKEKSTEIVEVAESVKPVKKAAKGKLSGLKPAAKAKIVKEESSGGSKPIRKKSVVRK